MTTTKRRGYSRDNVTAHTSGYGSPMLPAVNVKRHLWEEDFPDAMLRDVAEESGEDPAAFLAWWKGQGWERIGEMIEGQDGYGWRWWAFSSELESLSEWCSGADDALFPDHAVTLETEGRSGGWIVARGLPDLEEWDAITLARWRKFERIVGEMVKGFPWQVAVLICQNTYESPEVVDRGRRDRWARAYGANGVQMVEAGAW